MQEMLYNIKLLFVKIYGELYIKKLDEIRIEYPDGLNEEIIRKKLLSNEEYNKYKHYQSHMNIEMKLDETFEKLKLVKNDNSIILHFSLKHNVREF
jgi:hypothetical protein